ncbi:hypothetical protein [Pedobacter soli]|uniref:Uncharacterized protein n=1 Tax=Pedobacter soli TaxID=390242 RepID=A0A1G7ASY0_9SPHI|nr:hypothetical protein [Pedobacter soli]SDE18004.1 hypothetical protein SAMN04488024_11345 [Pedobacter soli]
MQQHIDFVKLLLEVASKAVSVEEQWGYLKLSGNTHVDLLKDFKEIRKILSALGFTNLAHLTVNGNPVNLSDLDLYTNSAIVKSWIIDINKIPLISLKNTDGWHYNIFLGTAPCLNWLRLSNPLLKKHPFNEFTPLRVIIADLKDPFGGDSIQFLSPAEQNIAQPSNTATAAAPQAVPKLPAGQSLHESVHFITAEDIQVNLNAYQTYSSGTSDLKEIFLYKACNAMSMYLLDEYYSNDKVIVNGIKRVLFKLDDGSTRVNEKFYQQMVSLISWIYEDRVSVRKKLFNERITLDMQDGDTLLTTLSKNISNAAEQAKERYNFVIIERKDAYVKELKELLKDIRTQSELYSGKIRTLLSNFLRDLLGAIILVGFTIFTKFTENTKLLNEDLLEYVFYGLALYYLVSILMQSIVDISDVNVSKKEMMYWKNATKELLPEKEFRQHIDKSLKDRKISLRIIYPVIAICYLVIAVACFKYPSILKELLAKNLAKKELAEHERKQFVSDSLKIKQTNKSLEVAKPPSKEKAPKNAQP